MHLMCMLLRGFERSVWFSLKLVFISAAFRWDVLWISFGAWIDVSRVSLTRYVSFLLELAFVSIEVSLKVPRISSGD